MPARIGSIKLGKAKTCKKCKVKTYNLSLKGLCVNCQTKYRKHLIKKKKYSEDTISTLSTRKGSVGGFVANNEYIPINKTKVKKKWQTKK
jgi:hypothetical protein